ncbi:MAG: glycosyltransferase family 1 protein [Saprospiraceae bacterium]
MVIAFDAKRLFHNFTGLGNYSRTLVKNLQFFYPEHSYHLFTSKFSVNEESKYFLDKEKFTIHTSSNPLWRSFGMRREINSLRPDIYHGLSHEIPTGLHPSICQLVTFHDLIYEIYPHQFGLWDRKMYQKKYRRSAKLADGIIAISQSTKQDLLTYYQIPGKKVKVLFQSCNEVFQTNIPAMKTDLIQEKDYFLYVGSLIERKNVENILRAFAKLDESQRKPFILVGSGLKNYVQHLKKMMHSLNIQQWFRMIPHVSNEQLVSLYDHAFALVYPSIYEGFGIPVIEALFRKKPVISSQISSLPEACGPGGLLVDPYQIDELSNALVEVQQNQVHKCLTEDGYKYVSQTFSSKVTTEAVMAYYEAMNNTNKAILPS